MGRELEYHYRLMEPLRKNPEIWKKVMEDLDEMDRQLALHIEKQERFLEKLAKYRARQEKQLEVLKLKKKVLDLVELKGNLMGE